ELAQLDLKSTSLSKDRIQKITYRPFDTRFTYYTGKTRGFHCMPRHEVMQHMSQENLLLSTARRVEVDRPWDHVFLSDSLIQHHTVSLKEVNYAFPLYLYP